MTFKRGQYGLAHKEQHMSSWLLPQRHLQVIRDGLLARIESMRCIECGALDSREKIDAFVRKLSKMNAAGYNHRYSGPQMRAQNLPSSVRYLPSDMQLYKALSCLVYQASEGNTLDNHSDVVRLVRQVQFILMDEVICKTKEWEDAEWGIWHDTKIPQIPKPAIAPKTKNLQGILRKVRKNA